MAITVLKTTQLLLPRCRGHGRFALEPLPWSVVFISHVPAGWLLRNCSLRWLSANTPAFPPESLPALFPTSASPVPALHTCSGVCGAQAGAQGLTPPLPLYWPASLFVLPNKTLSHALRHPPARFPPKGNFFLYSKSLQTKRCPSDAIHK